MSDPRPTVIAYTDGACSGNPGAGAWAYRLEWPDNTVEEAAEAEPMTTNNREELKAVREALRAVRARIHDDPRWRIVVQAPDRGVPRLLLQCVQHPEQVDAWLDACGWPVRARTAPSDRGRIYPTWLVEVPQ